MNQQEKPGNASEGIFKDITQFDFPDSNEEKFIFFGYSFSSYELGFLCFSLCCFLASYIVCHLAGVTYSSPMHARILYAVFVLLNIIAAAICFFAWIKIPSRSLVRDATLFLTISVVCAATGNLIDFLFWIFNIVLFKQSVFTNLFFIFAILCALPGVHLLGKLCRVEFDRQPIYYYLGTIAVSLSIPLLMNPGILKATGKQANPKEVMFGLVYSIGIGYLASISLFLWKQAQGRLYHSARLVSLGCFMLSVGCSIYAGLFIGINIEEIPSHPVHIIIALGYIFVALGLRHTELIINTIFNRQDNLPPSLPLIEIFGPSQGMAVYKKMETSIKATLEELLRSKAEGEIKQRIIGELETEVKLRKETERALIFEKEKAEEANKTKSQFLAMMSHELKTPLTAIKGYGQILSTTTGPASTLSSEKVHEIAGQIVINSNHLQNMIDGILRFSQLENGSFNYNIENFNLAEVLDYIDSLLLQQQFPMANFTVRIPERNLILHTDRLSLQHIIVNLLTNAFKFCREGNIVLAIRRSGADLFVSVEDNGVGIAPGHLSSIFEAFYQVSHGNKRKFGGTGLGLSVVKKLTEDLKGKITVDSEPDKGSTFEVILPGIVIEGNPE